jgi:1-acyl-sn-glycerol-3-phosphate acyltransferase
MAIKSLAEIREFFGELWKLKKHIPEIKHVLKYFYLDENPKKCLEKIIETARKNPVLDDLLKVNKTYAMISKGEERADKRGWYYACLEAVKAMGVNYEVRGAENIPGDGGNLYVSNHPYGLVDAIILIGGLGSLISKKGRQLKIIAMNQLRFIRGIEKIVYFVHSTAKKINVGSLKECLRYLDNGGDLAIYPSGRMSGPGLNEYPWKNGLGAFVSHSSYVVPAWFSGPNHTKIYNFLAKHKSTEQLRTVFSLGEVWNKAGQTVVLNIGKPIKPEKLTGDIEEKIHSLRQTAEALRVAV